MSFRFDDHVHEHEGDGDDDDDYVISHHRGKSGMTPHTVDDKSRTVVEVDVEDGEEEDQTKELSVLLDSITDEFDKLISSFELTVSAANTGDGAANVDVNIDGTISSQKAMRSISSDSTSAAFDLTEFERMMDL
jgi:hypothetical protein